MCTERIWWGFSFLFGVPLVLICFYFFMGFLVLVLPLSPGWTFMSPVFSYEKMVSSGNTSSHFSFSLGSIIFTNLVGKLDYLFCLHASSFLGKSGEVSPQPAVLAHHHTSLSQELLKRPSWHIFLPILTSLSDGFSAASAVRGAWGLPKPVCDLVSNIWHNYIWPLVKHFDLVSNIFQGPKYW